MPAERARRFHRELYDEPVLRRAVEEFQEIGDLSLTIDGDYAVVTFKVEDEPAVAEELVLEFSNLALARSIDARR